MLIGRRRGGAILTRHVTAEAKGAVVNGWATPSITIIIVRKSRLMRPILGSFL